MFRKQVVLAITVLLLLLAGFGCSAETKPAETKYEWTKAIVPGATEIHLLVADPYNNNLFALEQVAEKTFRVWGSRDLGLTWIKMGTVTPELYRTRQIKPDNIKDADEPLFIWPAVPGNLPLELNQPGAVINQKDEIYLFVARDNEVRRAVLSPP